MPVHCAQVEQLQAALAAAGALHQQLEAQLGAAQSEAVRAQEALAAVQREAEAGRAGLQVCVLALPLLPTPSH